MGVQHFYTQQTEYARHSQQTNGKTEFQKAKGLLQVHQGGIWQGCLPQWEMINNADCQHLQNAQFACPPKRFVVSTLETLAVLTLS